MARTVTRRTILGVLAAAPVLGAASFVWAQDGLPVLSVTEAYDALTNGALILIDVRQPREWSATGVAQGARLVDMRRTDFIAEIRAIRDLNPDTPIGFICARGVRSAQVQGWAQSAGISNVVDISEGMLGSRAGPGWLAQNLPVSPPTNDQIGASN